MRFLFLLAAALSVVCAISLQANSQHSQRSTISRQESHPIIDKRGFTGSAGKTKGKPPGGKGGEHSSGNTNSNSKPSRFQRPRFFRSKKSGDSSGDASDELPQERRDAITGGTETPSYLMTKFKTALSKAEQAKKKLKKQPFLRKVQRGTNEEEDDDEEHENSAVWSADLQQALQGVPYPGDTKTFTKSSKTRMKLRKASSKLRKASEDLKASVVNFIAGSKGFYSSVMESLVAVKATKVKRVSDKPPRVELNFKPAKEMEPSEQEAIQAFFGPLIEVGQTIFVPEKPRPATSIARFRSKRPNAKSPQITDQDSIMTASVAELVDFSPIEVTDNPPTVPKNQKTISKKTPEEELFLAYWGAVDAQESKSTKRKRDTVADGDSVEDSSTSNGQTKARKYAKLEGEVVPGLSKTIASKRSKKGPYFRDASNADYNPALDYASKLYVPELDVDNEYHSAHANHNSRSDIQSGEYVAPITIDPRADPTRREYSAEFAKQYYAFAAGTDSEGSSTLGEGEDIMSREVHEKERRSAALDVPTTHHKLSRREQPKSEKAQLQEYADFYAVCQEEVAELIWPTIENILAAANAESVYMMAWSIFADLTRSQTSVSGPYWHGLHGFDQLEDMAKAQGASEEAMAEMMAVDAALIEFYESSWENATNALKGTDLEKTMDKLAEFLQPEDESLIPDEWMQSAEWDPLYDVFIPPSDRYINTAFLSTAAETNIYGKSVESNDWKANYTQALEIEDQSFENRTDNARLPLLFAIQWDEENGDTANTPYDGSSPAEGDIEDEESEGVVDEEEESSGEVDDTVENEQPKKDTDVDVDEDLDEEEDEEDQEDQAHLEDQDDQDDDEESLQMK